MTSELSSMLYLFLRSKDALTEDEKRQIKEVYEREGREKVETFLRKEKSNVPFASLLLSELKIDGDYWRQIHQTYIDRNEPILALVDKVFDNYYKKGGKSLCVYENFGAMLSSGISLGCFASNDVDLTADREEKEFLVANFAESGFALDRRGNHPIDNEQISTFHNPDALNGKGWWLNVMWQTTSRAYMVDQSRFNKRLSVERNHGELYKDTSIRMLQPNAMAYYCALHIAIEHFFSASPGMCLYCDVDRVAGFNSIDWDMLVKWSKEDEAGLRLKLVLDICHYFLKTEVPLEKFGEPTAIYNKLWNRIVDVEHNYLIAQNGKFRRLSTELMSDDMPLIKSLFYRIWKR